MVCPKLSDGICGVTKANCKAKYEIKMINHGKCRHYSKKKNAKKTRARKRGGRLF